MTDFYIVTDPPAETPVTFSESSEWCRDIEDADEDLATALIAAATNILEKMTNRVFIKRSITGKFAGLCLSLYEIKPFVEIRRSPLIQIDTVRINGDIVAATEYELKESSSFSRLLFPNGPTLDTDSPFPIEVAFQAGYGDAIELPGDIKTMVQQTVLFWYENRGDISPDEKQPLPFVVKQILKSYRIVNTF